MKKNTKKSLNKNKLFEGGNRSKNKKSNKKNNQNSYVNVKGRVNNIEFKNVNMNQFEKEEKKRRIANKVLKQFKKNINQKDDIFHNCNNSDNFDN